MYFGYFHFCFQYLCWNSLLVRCTLSPFCKMEIFTLYVKLVKLKIHLRCYRFYFHYLYLLILLYLSLKSLIDKMGMFIIYVMLKIMDFIFLHFSFQIHYLLLLFPLNLISLNKKMDVSTLILKLVMVKMNCKYFKLDMFTITAKLIKLMMTFSNFHFWFLEV